MDGRNILFRKAMVYRFRFEPDCEEFESLPKDHQIDPEPAQFVLWIHEMEVEFKNSGKTGSFHVFLFL
jgi:hypothetical protein